MTGPAAWREGSSLRELGSNAGQLGRGERLEPLPQGSFPLGRPSRPLVGVHGGVRISQLDVKVWVADLTVSGRAPANVHKAYQTLSKVMRAAVDGGLIAQSPCRSVALPRIERQEMRFLIPDEIHILADAMPARYRAMVTFDAYCGLRMGELAGLRCGRVDLLRRQVRVIETAVE